MNASLRGWLIVLGSLAIAALPLFGETADRPDARKTARPSAGRGMTARPDTESGFRLWPWGEYARLATEALSERRKYMIRASYYSQSQYNWCWAACASMMLASADGSKRPIQPQQIAEAFGKTSAQGASLFPVLGVNLENLRGPLNLPPFAIVQNATAAVHEQNLRGFLIDRLRNARPVWIGVTSFAPGQGDHAVLVVGYDHVGFYIHDPSGAMVKYILERRRNSVSEEDLQKKLACFRIRFDEWRDMLGSWGFGALRANLAYVNVEHPAVPKTATLQLLAAPFEDPGLSFLRKDLTAADTRQIQFRWNGLAKGGCGFSRASTTDGNLWATEGLSNSDEVEVFYAVAHNSSDERFSGYITVNLDDRPLEQRIDGPAPREAARFPVQVAEETTNQRVELVSERNPSRSQQLVKDALTFPRWPLPLGEHRLVVTLHADSGKELDTVVVPFVMKPAVVPNVRVARRPVTQRTHQDRVSWDASPEEARLGAANCVYQVYRQLKDRSGPEGRPVLVATITEPGKHDAVFPIGNEVGAPDPLVIASALQYYVTVVERASRLESPLSQPANVRVDTTPVADADLTGARGSVTRVRPDADLSGARGSLTPARPTPVPVGPAPTPKPTPTPVLPRPATTLEPFYAVFELHLPMPPKNRDGFPDIKAPDDRWIPEKTTMIAFHISGPALRHYARQSGVVSEADIFRTARYYHQDITVLAPDKGAFRGTILLKYVGSTKDALGSFGAFRRPPFPPIRGNEKPPGLIVEMSEVTGGFPGFVLSSSVPGRVQGGPIESDGTHWSPSSRSQAARLVRSILQGFFGN